MAASRLQALIDDAKRRKGRWRLTRDHEVEYRSEGPREEFSIKGPIVAVEPGRLVFSATEKTSDQETVTRLVRLDGTWSVNSRNQIVFAVEKESGRADELTFASGWHLDERFEIVYTYKQTVLKTRRRLERELVFSGAWELSEKNRIVFLLGGDERSRLRFRGAFQTPSILAKKGEIRYQIGAEGRAGRQAKALVFFGKWKVSRLFGLSFELETAEKKKRVLNFGGEWNFGGRSVAVNLRAPKGERLGVEVIFSREFWKDGEFFLNLQRSPEESRAEAGVRWTA